MGVGAGVTELTGRLRRLVLPCCDLVYREYGTLNGGTYAAYYPRYWLFGLFPVKIGWSSARYRYDLALKLVEKDKIGMRNCHV